MTSFFDILLPMEDNQHHGTSIFHNFKDPFCRRRMPEMKVFNSSSLYHLSLVHEHDESMISH